MVPAIFFNIKNSTTIIHNLATLHMFPSKGNVLHIPYGSYQLRQRETSDTERVFFFFFYNGVLFHEH